MEFVVAIGLVSFSTVLTGKHWGKGVIFDIAIIFVITAKTKQ